MIGWLTAAQAVVAATAGVLAIGLGLAGRRPSDLSLAGPAVVEVLLVGQAVVAVVSPLTGNPCSGNAVEYVAYLLGALVIPPAGIVWALTERTRWSVVVVGVACLAVAVMLVRMQVIWTLQQP